MKFFEMSKFWKCHFVDLTQAVDLSEDRYALGSLYLDLFRKFDFSHQFLKFKMKVYMKFFKMSKFWKCHFVDLTQAVDLSEDRYALGSLYRRSISKIWFLSPIFKVQNESLYEIFSKFQNFENAILYTSLRPWSIPKTVTR